MIIYCLDWETQDGAVGHDQYTNDYEALCDMEGLASDPEVVFASVTEFESFDGIICNISKIREFERSEVTAI